MTNINAKIFTLVKIMIECHDNGDFDKLKTLMDKNTLDSEDTFFTREKFEEVSRKIHQQLGSHGKIEFIGQLNKKNTIHTLWKVKYSNTEDDILWQASINLDDKNPKIIRMSVN
jgi:hypothetical protein